MATAKTTTLTFRIEPELKEALRTAAEREHRSIANMVSVLIRDYCDRNGDYILSFPFSDDRELIQDLLRYTPNVYVEAPVKLRKALQSKLQQGLELSLGRGLGWL